MIAYFAQTESYLKHFEETTQRSESTVEIQRMKEPNKDLDRELTDKIQKLDELESELSARAQKLVETKSELSLLDNKKTELMTQIGDLGIRINNNEVEISKTRKVYAESVLQLAKLQAEIRAAEVKKAENEKQTGISNTRLESLKRDEADRSAVLIKIGGELQEKSGALQGAQNQIKEIEQRKVVLENCINDLNSRINELSTRNKELGKTYSQNAAYLLSLDGPVWSQYQVLINSFSQEYHRDSLDQHIMMSLFFWLLVIYNFSKKANRESNCMTSHRVTSN